MAGDSKPLTCGNSLVHGCPLIVCATPTVRHSVIRVAVSGRSVYTQFMRSVDITKFRSSQIASYLRESQAGAKSVDEHQAIGTQRHAVDRSATQYGVTIGREYCDEKSASIYGKRKGVIRGDWQQFKKDANAGKIKLLFMSEFGRGTRDLSEYGELSEIIIRNEIIVIANNRYLDLRDVNDWTIAAMDIMLADRYARELSDRIRRGIASSQVEGRPPAGRCPMGYYRPPRKTGEKVTQLPHPEESRLINSAAKDIVERGRSLRDVAREWSTLKLRGEKWDQRRVRRSLLNPALIGMRINQGEILRRGTWQPIIDVETFAKLSSVIKDPKRRTADWYGGRGAARNLLSGVIAGLCGEPTYYKGPYKRKSGYRCASRYTCKDGCTGRQSEPTDRIVTEVVISVLAALIRDHVLSELRIGRLQQDSSIPELHDKAEKATKEFQSFKENWEDWGWRPELAGEHMSKLHGKMISANKDLSRAQREKAKITNVPNLLASVAGEISSLADEIGLASGHLTRPVVMSAWGEYIHSAAVKLWKNMDVMEQRAVIRQEMRLSFLPGVKGSSLSASDPKLIRFEFPNHADGWNWLAEYRPLWTVPGTIIARAGKNSKQPRPSARTPHSEQ